MPKNVVVCCDGTGNSFENPETDSNVVKLYSSLTIDENQVAYYHPGVGTMGDPNARNRVARQWTLIKGMAFGAGLQANIGDAYRYLMNNYADGDQIYLFGFSRGAYTARALASLLHVYGLLCAGNDGLIPYILRLYSKTTREANYKKRTFETDESFKWQFSHSHPVNVHFCGVWDTVSSYGWIYSPIKLPFEGDNPIIRIGRHAISIHERRCFFQDNLWGKGGDGQDLHQVWFSGVHSDIGGSYDESESGLSKITLEWMMVEAGKAGLLLNRDKAETVLGRQRSILGTYDLPGYVEPDPNGAKHESLTGFWWIPEFMPQMDPHAHGKRFIFPHGRSRQIPPGSYVHESVLAGRWKPGALPPHEVEPRIPY